MREQKHSQANPRFAGGFNVDAASFPPVDTTSGRNFQVVQSNPSTSRVAMGSRLGLLQTEHPEKVRKETPLEMGPRRLLFHISRRVKTQHGKVALEAAYVSGEGFITIRTGGAGDALGWSGLFPPHQWHFSARAVEPTEAVVFKANALRNKAKETPAFGYDLALRVGGMILQQLQATRTRLLDILEVSA